MVKKIRMLLCFLFFIVIINYLCVYAITSSRSESQDISLNIENIDYTSAEITWEYPKGINFNMGDYLNLILIDESIGDNGQIPIYSVTHNINKIDLESTTSYEVNNLSPLHTYKVIIELVESTGDMYIGESSFKTAEFIIKGIKFENAEENLTNKKNVKLSWEISDPNIRFNPEDSVQIFMKKFSDNDFYKKPIFESKKPITDVDITIPHIEDTYEFKIVYTLGNNHIESEIFFLDVYSMRLDTKVEELTTGSVKLKWNIFEEELLNDKSKLEIYLKENEQVDYNKNPILKLAGKSEIVKIKEFLLENLKFNSKYKVKFKYVIETKHEFGVETPIFIEEEYEFQTKDISIENLKITNVMDNKCSISWDYKGDNINFSQNDKLDIYIKEFSDNKYSQKPLTIIENLKDKKTTEIVLPKLNINYDIKLDFNIGNKHIFQFLSHIIETPEINFKLKILPNNVLEILPEYNEKNIFNNGDKIKIFSKKNTDSEYGKEPVKELEQTSIDNIKDKKNIQIQSLEPKSIYNFKIQIIKNGYVFQEKVYKVGINENELQIINVYFNKKSSKEVEAIIEYAPYDYDFSKVESLILTKNLKGKDNKEEVGKVTSDFKNNNKFNIIFPKVAVYDLNFQYTFKPDTQPITRDEKKEGNTITLKTVVYTQEYTHNLDFFSYKIVDSFLGQLKFGFIFEKYYPPKKGDNIKIYMKNETEKEFSKNPIVYFEHDKDNIKLDKIDIFDVVGIEHNSKYSFKAVFTSIDYKETPVEIIIDISSPNIDILNVTVEHLSDITGKVTWKLGKEFQFGPADKLKIFYKEEGKGSFSKDADEVIENLYDKSGTLFYVDKIDTKYDVKLIFECGSKTIIKEFKLNTKIKDIQLEIQDIYETSAYIKWEYPEEYLITDGECILLYLKESSETSYGEEPYIFVEHNEEEEEFIDTFKSIKLTDLNPNTSYNVKAVFDLGDLGQKNKEVTFKTKDIFIKKIDINDFKQFEFNINVELNSETIDFNEEIDFLNVFVKKKSEAWDDEKLMYSLSKGMKKTNDFRILIDDINAVYDVKVEYSIIDKVITENMSSGVFNIDYEENENGNIDILLKYPSSFNFKDGDEVVVYLCDPKTNKYKEKTSVKHTSKNNLKDTKSINIKNVPQTASIAVAINSKHMNVFPSEIVYDTRNVHSSTLEIVGELKGCFVDIGLPKDYELDIESEILNSIGGTSYYETLDDGETIIVIDNLVPNKQYKDVLLVTYDVNGEEVELHVDEFMLEPSSLLEDFLYNSYYFAFDRKPDEGGYTYWKQELEDKRVLTGKFFLINLMFAEKEFANRNLSDEELIKTLYQIVVNREYDQKGLSYWMIIYKKYLDNFNGDKFEAKKTIVMRMAYEPEYEQLCKEMGIEW